MSVKGCERAHLKSRLEVVSNVQLKSCVGWARRTRHLVDRPPWLASNTIIGGLQYPNDNNIYHMRPEDALSSTFT